MPNKDIPIKEQILVEFAEKYSSFELCDTVKNDDYSRLKYFLSQSLDRLLTEVKKRVSAIREPKCGLCDENIPGAECRCTGDEIGHNQALDTVINIIAELKK